MTLSPRSLSNSEKNIKSVQVQSSQDKVTCSLKESFGHLEVGLQEIHAIQQFSNSKIYQIPGGSIQFWFVGDFERNIIQKDRSG